MIETPYKTPTVTVANGATTSDAADLNGLLLCGVVLPAEADGTTLGFSVSTDNSTFYTLRNASTGTDISYTVTASRAVALDPSLFAAFRYVKAVLASQTGATVVTLACRPL
jgi:hypothetical protein